MFHNSVPISSVLKTIEQFELFEMFRFEESDFQDRSLPDSARVFLQSIGLPDRCAPHMSFGNKSLPSDTGISRRLPYLKDWEFLEDLKHPFPESLAQKIVLGSVSSPICIERDGSILYYDEEMQFQPIFMNSDPESLLRSCVAYQYLIHETLEVYKGYQFSNKLLTDEQTKAFMDEIHRIDATAMSTQTFWHLAVQKKSRLHTF